MSINSVLRQILTASSPDEAVRMAWSVIRYAEAAGVNCEYARRVPAVDIGDEDAAVHGTERVHAATSALYALEPLGWQKWPIDPATMLAWGVGGRAVPRQRAPETPAEHESRVARARFAGAWGLATTTALCVARNLGGRLAEVTAAAIEGRRLEGFGGDGCPSACDIAESVRIRKAEGGSGAGLDALEEYANAKVTFASLSIGFRASALFACVGVAPEVIEAAEVAAVAESDRREALRVTLLPAWEVDPVVERPTAAAG